MKNSDSQEELKKLIQRFIAAHKHLWSNSTIKRYGYLLNLFVQWMHVRNLSLEDLSAHEIKDLEAYLIKRIHFIFNRYGAKLIHHRFICWLFERKRISSPPQELFVGMYLNPRLEVHLPRITREFFDFILTQVTRSTASKYKHALKHLYLFCETKGLIVENMRRPQFELFLRYLAKTGLSPGTTNLVIISVRVYLHWLYERNLMRNDPDELLKTSDIPKEPHYLPRALPFEIDQEIQRRLSHSENIYHRALLLVRKTGMRAGEALSLAYDCLKHDGQGNYSLKVPLGKLKKERMIPLEMETVSLIETLHKQCDSYSHIKRDNLLCNPSGGTLSYHFLRIAFKEITHDIQSDEPLVIHRLRHSYATTLLNAGMSLVSLREVLGHHDLKMTLRYAAITQNTIREEYFSAIKTIAIKYQHVKLQNRESHQNGSENFNHLILSLKKAIKDDKKLNPKRTSSLLKRLNRLQVDLSVLSVD